MEYIFDITGLVKEYEGQRILDIEELHLEKGKITAVIGPSGAGKSTLLSILNGLDSATSGKIEFDGKVIGRTPDIATRRQMSMVFQKPVVFNTTVFENIAYSLKLRGLPSKETRKHVEELAELVGLKEKIRQKAVTLSGGEAQRLTLARAMVFKPKVLLLDEPTANLDPANVAMIEKLILHAKTEYGTSVIIVTHNMFQAKRISDNVVFLLNGNTIENGKASEVFSAPRDSRTLDFIEGKMVY
ncbi:MAG: phosphate ABC transporter ATP-binding protein [Caulobacteraceae bacterium]